QSVRRQVVAIISEEEQPGLSSLKNLISQSDNPVGTGMMQAARELGVEDICATVRRSGLGFVQVGGTGRSFEAPDAEGDAEVAEAPPARPGREPDGGELTPLVYAARTGSIEAAKVLLDAGADVNQTTRYGWS